MPHLERGDARVYYEDDGAGLPILLSHGFGASTGMWRGQVEAFKDRYRLIRMDMRGHGRTDCPEDLSHYSQDLTVDDMASLLDHFGVRASCHCRPFAWRIHVLGPSMLRIPIGRRRWSCKDAGLAIGDDEPRAAWNERAERRALTLEEGGLAVLGGGAEVGESVQPSAKSLAQAARGILSQVDSRVIDSLPGISVPTLVIIGDGDKPFLDGARYMADRIPGATYVEVPGAGHGVNVEKPEVVNEALAKFLGGL